MSEAETRTNPETAPRPASEPARMGALSRFFNVFASPGKVFEDVRRDPRGWWVPLVICAATGALFLALYYSRYDQGLVVREQLKSNWQMKLVPEDQREKQERLAIGIAEVTPAWHSQLQYAGYALFGFAITIWFLAFLYTLIALMMGWVREPSGLRLMLNGLAGVGLLLLFVAVAAGIGIGMVQAIGGQEAKTFNAPPNWIPIGGFVASLVISAGFFFAIWRLTRVPEYARVVGATAWGLSPLALSGLVGALVVLVRQPDGTYFANLVPSSVTGLLLDTATAPPWLASLGSSLDLFWIWSMVLIIIGLSRTLGRTLGEAATLVLVPWGAWVLIKVGAAAIFSSFT